MRGVWEWTMQSLKFVMLGAGPSEQSFAHALKSLGEDSFLILEKETVAGGVCRSEDVNGSPLQGDRPSGPDGRIRFKRRVMKK